VRKPLQWIAVLGLGGACRAHHLNAVRPAAPIFNTADMPILTRSIVCHAKRKGESSDHFGSPRKPKPIQATVAFAPCAGHLSFEDRQDRLGQRPTRETTDYGAAEPRNLLNAANRVEKVPQESHNNVRLTV
jgi:hypothetical protein